MVSIRLASHRHEVVVVLVQAMLQRSQVVLVQMAQAGVGKVEVAIQMLHVFWLVFWRVSSMLVPGIW